MSAALIRPEWLQRTVGILGAAFPFVLVAAGGERESIPTGPGLSGWLHLAGALVFFSAIAALVWRFGRGSRPRTFRALSAGIGACIAWALVAGLSGGSIFAAETVAVLLFGAAWTIKGRWLERVA